MKTISSADMRELDRRTIEEFNVPGDVLMERAGQGVAEITLDILNARMGDTVLLIAGTGNNGGDVFAAASFLAEVELDVVVWICGSKRKIKGDAEYHLKKMIRRGIHPVEVEQDRDLVLERTPAVIVDGLLGTGAKGAPRGFMSEVIDFINEEAHRSFVLSIDIPSGVDADSGIAEGAAVRANLTATMCLPKTGLIRPEAIPYVGNIEVIDIGIPAILKEQVAACPDAELIDRANLLIPFRGNETHKGDHGHVLLIGGSIGFTGAIAMAARAALRSGAGLVSVLTPEEVYPIVAQAAGPEIMVHPVPNIGKLDVDFSKHWKKVNAVCAGPGLGQHPELIEQLLKSCPVPLVLDADALCVSPEQIAAATCPVVLTPHPGEFERLFGKPITDRWAQTRAAAGLTGQTVALKGAGTVVAHPDYKMGVNMSGNPGMATAGSGDVLAGILSALLGRDMEPFEAAITAVHLHGLAGDIAAEDMTQEAMIATDIIRALPDAFRMLQFS
ncbi:MAG: NAD(P)H-hydrate dehydratase [Kiritimatiellales bacterium]|nr:NAD(P)H-hydrate dehydratase [Kiritimatiellales bacterium]